MGFTVSKNKTIAWLTTLFLMFFALSVSSNTMGQYNPGPHSTIEKLCGSQKGQLAQECYEKYLDKIISPNNSCSSDVKDLQKSLQEFNKSCQSSGMKKAGKTCIDSVNHCEKCVGADPDTDSDCMPDGITENDEDEEHEDDEDANGFWSLMQKTLKGQTGGLDYGSSSKRKKPNYKKQEREAGILYANCPVMAAEDLERYRDDKKEAKEEVKSLKEQLEDANSALTGAQKDSQSELLAIEEEMQQIQNQFQDNMDELQKALKNVDKEGQAQIQELRDNFDKAASEIKKLANSMNEAYLGHLNALTQIDQECQTNAREQLEKVRDRNRQKMSRGRLSQKRLSSLFRSSGLTSLQQSQRKIDKYYARCTKKKSHRQKLHLAKKAYEHQLNVINQAIKDLRLQQQKIYQAIQQVSNELPQRKQEITLEMHKLNQRMQQQIQLLQQKKISLQQQTQAKNLQLTQKVNRIKGELEDQDDYFNHLQSMLSLKQKYTKGSKSTGEKGNTLSLAQDATNSAEAALNSCDCCGDNGSRDRSCHFIIRKASELGLDPCTAPDSLGAPNNTTKGKR